MDELVLSSFEFESVISSFRWKVKSKHMLAQLSESRRSWCISDTHLFMQTPLLPMTLCNHYYAIIVTVLIQLSQLMDQVFLLPFYK